MHLPAAFEKDEKLRYEKALDKNIVVSYRNKNLIISLKLIKLK
jgi:hypothetical protein